MKKVLRFWWGSRLSDMSVNRHRCYRSIIKNSKIRNIEMISLDNYHQYEVAEHPIHPAFPYLSVVHQSDYLRVYISYFHGGGWTDVKYCDTDWNQYFDMLEARPDKDGIGYRVMYAMGGKFELWPDDYHHAMCIDMQQFIFKPKSVIFKEYLKCVEDTLDQHLEQLKRYPGHVHPYICKDNDSNEWLPDHLRNYPYPLNWLEISQHFYNCQVPHLEKVMYGMPFHHNAFTGHNHR